MLSDNIQYEVVKSCTIIDNISGNKKLILSRTYAGIELLSVVGGMAKLAKFVNDDQVMKTNKLVGITEMTFNLDKLSNTDTLEDGKPRNTLLTI